MPPLNELLSLYTIVENRVFKWLLQCLKKSESPVKKTLQRNYVSSILNIDIRQKLLSKIMNLHNYILDVTNKCHFIVLLGDEQIRIIDLSSSDIFIDEVFYLYHALTVASLTNLSKLRLHCLIKGKVDEKYILEVNSVFYKSIKDMTRLKVLTLTGIGETQLLEVIGKFCPFLEHVDISNSNLVNDESVASLLLKECTDTSDMSFKEIVQYSGPLNRLCSKLQYFGLANTDVSTKVIILSLNVLPNICSFGGYIPNCSFGEVLECLYSEDSKICFKLTHIWDFFLNKGQASVISNTCPQLISFSTGCCSLNSAINLKCLSYLTLDCDFKQFNDEILDFLYEKGSTLQNLTLTDHVNCHIDLSSLSDYCPNLQELSAPLSLWEGCSVANFTHLIRSEIWISSSKCLEEFLMNCPNLEDLKIYFIPLPYQETFSCINDEFLLKILTLGGLQKLITLYIENCNLGEVALEALLVHCLNLSSIGKLFYWSNLNMSFIKDLKERIKKLNWNLKFVIKEEYCDITV